MTKLSSFISAIGGRTLARAIDRRRMAILLGTLVLLVLASPLGEIATEARLVLTGATVVFLLSCLQQADAHPRLRRPARLLVLLWLTLNLPLSWTTTAWATSAAAATLATLIAIVLGFVARDIVDADRVDAELLCGVIGAYLLLGVFWAETYGLINLFAPDAFAEPGGKTPDQSALLYFSFTTLTTTGYGDITAINPLVRMWTIFEAIIGTVYNATIVARMVSLYGSRVRRDPE